MTWIDFSKERPREEPKREIWVRFKNGVEGKRDTHYLGDTIEITDWAEIEPPSSPTPDPFEVWWEDNGTKYQGPPYPIARVAWDAAIKWKEGK